LKRCSPQSALALQRFEEGSTYLERRLHLARQVPVALAEAVRLAPKRLERLFELTLLVFSKECTLTSAEFREPAGIVLLDGDPGEARGKERRDGER
jgi:hypothetical protein